MRDAIVGDPFTLAVVPSVHTDASNLRLTIRSMGSAHVPVRPSQCQGASNRQLPAGARVVKVRLVGTLPGSAFRRILSTETLEVRIKE
jgi:hypothetical protein